jgi:dienelactone hydrolase
VRWLLTLWSMSLAIALQAGQPATAPDAEFACDRSRPFDLEIVKVEPRGGVTIQDVSYAQLDGARNRAYIVAPPAARSHPGVLFVHWLEDNSPTANRTEFLDEAIELSASSGAVAVLPDTMWTKAGWFAKRNPAEDYASSIRQTNELRRALDLLASRPGVDAGRLLLVGHDFGAMYGAVAAGLEPARVKAFVFMAGTQSFSDWFLLYPKLAGEARQKVIDRLAPLDPTRYLAKLRSVPVLLQFGTKDRYVSRGAADALIASVPGPKTSRFYDADHSLAKPGEVRADRIAWLKQQLAR